MHVDWEQLATRTGSLSGGAESGSTAFAIEAIRSILGDDLFVEAVEHYVSHKPGAELARSVLWHLRPKAAMTRCYEIYRDSKSEDARQTAIELLRVVADRTALPWVAEFLADDDAAVQSWGAGVVDQLLWSSLVRVDECAAVLETMRDHANAQVRETHAWILEFLAERTEEADEEPADDGSTC
jgi:hypothetical protein